MNSIAEPIYVQGIMIHPHGPIQSREPNYVFAEWIFPFKQLNGDNAHGVVKYDKNLVILVYFNNTRTTVYSNSAHRCVDPNTTTINAVIRYNRSGYYEATDVVFHCRCSPSSISN